jgi:uncharacterized protein (TIGR02246 family)
VKAEDSALERRLAALETRVRALEDEAAIRSLIADYGPRVDSGDAKGAARLWEADGVYDVDELLMQGRAEIAAMVGSAAHQSWIRSGCAHVIGPPSIQLVGDEAVAVCHSLMLVHERGRFVVRRVTANHWTLRRGDEEWRVVVRTSRVLDGRPESPELLSRGVTPAAPGKD